MKQLLMVLTALLVAMSFIACKDTKKSSKTDSGSAKSAEVKKTAVSPSSEADAAALSLMKEVVSNNNNLADGLQNAKTAADGIKAIEDFGKNMATIQKKGSELNKKFPAYRPGGDAKAEMDALKKQADLSGDKIKKALTSANVKKFIADPKFKAAVGKLGAM
ncbi:MAG: hypothetical protein OEZ36_00745 [Spirochaetota bacterium]|nr:hypothetical protein [Spirochaetota bacterium]